MSHFPDFSILGLRIYKSYGKNRETEDLKKIHVIFLKKKKSKRISLKG